MSFLVVEKREAHADYVDALINESVAGLTPVETLRLFEQTLVALWEGARKILSEVTLKAVMERVILLNSESFRFLSLIKVEVTGIHMGYLESEAGSLSKDALIGATKNVLIDFLTIIGNITGEVLSKTLNAKLSQVVFENTSFTQRRTEGSAI